MSEERHAILGEDTGAYVLGALSDEEHTRFLRHLVECHLCRDEVDRLERAVDALARSVTPLQAPEGLRAAIMQEVHADLGEGSEASERPGPLARAWERLMAAANLRGKAVPLSAAALLFLGLVGGFGLSRALEDGGGERVVTARFDHSRAASGSGSLVIGGGSNDAGGTLRVHGMPSLPGDETYQVWLQRKGEVIPKALFNVSEDGNGLTAVDGDLQDADAVMVTREAAGGARSPTGKPVLTVKL